MTSTFYCVYMLLINIKCRLAFSAFDSFYCVYMLLVNIRFRLLFDAFDLFTGRVNCMLTYCVSRSGAHPPSKTKSVIYEVRRLAKYSFSVLLSCFVNAYQFAYLCLQVPREHAAHCPLSWLVKYLMQLQGHLRQRCHFSRCVQRVAASYSADAFPYSLGGSTVTTKIDQLWVGPNQTFPEK